MLQRLAADGVLTLHLLFIIFVVFGAIAAAWWPRLLLVQVPAAAWGAFVEIAGRSCPLTVIENRLRGESGVTNQGSDFIERSLLAVIYPEGLTQDLRWVLAGLVVTVNVAAYGWLLRRGARRRARQAAV